MQWAAKRKARKESTPETKIKKKQSLPVSYSENSEDWQNRSAGDSWTGKSSFLNDEGQEEKRCVPQEKKCGKEN